MIIEQLTTLTMVSSLSSSDGDDDKEVRNARFFTTEELFCFVFEVDSELDDDRRRLLFFF